MKARTKITIKFYGRLIGGYSAFFISVIAFSLLLNKLLEGIFIIVGYFFTRFSVPKIKHFDTTKKCIFVTTMTFLFTIAILCIPQNISIVWAVCAGAVIPIIMYAESLLFDVQLSEKDKLILRCKEKNYNPLKTDMAIKFFIDKEKPREVWLWLCQTQENPMSWDSVRTLKCKMRKELFGK